MALKEEIAENLRFMCLEVTRQVENTWKVLDRPSSALIESVMARDDYIDNLKSVIENECFSAINEPGTTKRQVDVLRAVTTVSSNLERTADHAVNIVDQVQYLKDPAFIKRYEYGTFFKEVLNTLEMVYKAVSNLDMSLAFRICRSEFTLDSLYKVQFDRILGELRSGSETENLITSHLILRYLERMGDALKNVGEAVIFAAVGEKFKIRQYEALRENLAKSGVSIPLSDVEFQSIWGTRSGCRIGRVSGGGEEADGAPPAAGVLFKEGGRRKLLKEKENIERWETIMPGLPPHVLSHRQEDSQASLLIEFLGGCTYQDVVLAADDEILKNATFLVEQTLSEVWEKTKAFGPGNAGFLAQIHSRLEDVYRLNPFLRQRPKTLGDCAIPNLETLLVDAVEVEKELPSPYTVFIHGDYNINNIVYDHANQQIHYIDLHRSMQSDPLQDISVFILSNFRMPIFDSKARLRLNWAAQSMFRFARSYSLEQGDKTFDARLAMGLARNFITSTRFELNRRFARIMFHRGIYLIERLLDHRGRPWETFVLNPAVMAY